MNGRLQNANVSSCTKLQRKNNSASAYPITGSTMTHGPSSIASDHTFSPDIRRFPISISSPIKIVGLHLQVVHIGIGILPTGNPVLVITYLIKRASDNARNPAHIGDMHL